MRKIEFNELKLKNINDEETFYQVYLKKLQKNINTDNNILAPIKQYEIFFLNILGGKLILLNKDYINNTDNTNSELFFDYSIATMKNLREDLFEKARKWAILKNENHPWKNMSNEEIVRSSGLYKEDVMTQSSS